MSPKPPITELNWGDFLEESPAPCNESPIQAEPIKLVVSESPSEQLQQESEFENPPTAPSTEVNSHVDTKKQTLSERRGLSEYKIPLPPSRFSLLATSSTSTESNLHVEHSTIRHQTELIITDSAAATTASFETSGKSEMCNSTDFQSDSNVPQVPDLIGSKEARVQGSQGSQGFQGSPSPATDHLQTQATSTMNVHIICHRHGLYSKPVPIPSRQFYYPAWIDPDNNMYVEYADRPVSEFNSFAEQYRMTILPLRFDIWMPNGTQRTFWNLE
ncbi:hypothetical protein BZA77DRAFT_297925 [Pyronema omphalodes]|nr:hypothetical protein BZA77DRAFT_297925 [Pyronema omphalodes]